MTQVAAKSPVVMSSPMTPAALRKFALSLPEASEQPHFERTSFRVGSKIFATMTADGTEAMVRVVPPERLEALIAGFPGVFFDYGGWTARMGALGVKLREVEPGLMRELVTRSHELVAPRRARAPGPPAKPRRAAAPRRKR
jgi:hypothetical protein